MIQRLNKVLAGAGVASRREADRLIEAGRVTVNGRVVRQLGVRVDAQRDAIKVDGKRVLPRSGVSTYLLLNKPRGVVTTLRDPQGRETVRDLLRGVRKRVFPVGRLDFDSEGLLLLTDDGDLARDLMHPGSGVPKTYHVKVRGRPAAEVRARLERGIRLDGRMSRASGVRVVRDADNAWLELTVVEGRKHLVRRMLRAVGHPVLKLRRVRYGGISLADLPSGKWRHLTPDEVHRLKHVGGVDRRN